MRLRTTFIVEGFQAQFVITLLAWVAVLTVLFVLLLVGPLAWALTSGATDRSAADALLVLHSRLWLPLAAFCAGLVVVTVLLTHRVAGPLYRFRRAFGEVARGNLAVRVGIRKRDFLHMESRAIEAMLAALSTKIEATRQAVIAVDQELAAAASEPDIRRRIAVAAGHTRDAVDALAAFTPRQAVAPPTVVAGTVRDAGFSVVELLMTCGIVVLVTSMAAPLYAEALNRARVAAAIGDINTISKDIAMFQAERGCFPSSLGDVRHAATIDPWGRPYRYAVPQAPGSGGRGGRGGRAGGDGATGSCGACGGACVGPSAARKDRNLVPINADYDLYSLGRDGQSVSPITAGPSRDDVIRGRTGGFIGLAAEY